jgi:putative thioredoxin
VAEASLQHVVVLSLWSPRSPVSIEVNTALSRLRTRTRAGSCSPPSTSTSFRRSRRPSCSRSAFVVALLRGQPVAQIPPSADEAALGQVLDQLVQAAVANGITGRVAPRAGAPDGPSDEPAEDPRFAEADAALGAGDLEGAIAAYSRW